jgi:hypothetical protein
LHKDSGDQQLAVKREPSLLWEFSVRPSKAFGAFDAQLKHAPISPK